MLGNIGCRTGKQSIVRQQSVKYIIQFISILFLCFLRIYSVDSTLSKHFFKRNFLKGLLLHFVFKFKDPLDAEIPEHQWVDVLPQLVEQEPVTESEKKHFISIQITLCFSDSKTSSRNMRA